MGSVKGRLTGQVSFIFKQMISFGEKKGELKRQALSDQKQFFAYYKAKIFSFSTFENYYEEAKKFTHWCYEQYHLPSVYRITPEMFSAYIKEANDDLKANTAKTRIAAILKFAEGLESATGKDKAAAFRVIAHQLYVELPKALPSRPVYTAQQIEALAKQLSETNPHYALVFQVHIETGCRLRELAQLSRRDLLGLVDGQQSGILAIRGKGGRMRELKISSSTYIKLATYLAKAEILCSYNGYRQALRRASESLGFGVVATHAVRRYVAQAVMQQSLNHYQQIGLAYKEAQTKALGDVNQLLGHSRERISTTRIYLNTQA